jgi:hypothetical protein
MTRTATQIHADLLTIIENGWHGYNFTQIAKEVDQLAAAAGHDGAALDGATLTENAREMVAVLSEIGAI